jgi:hypothetical protein
MGKLGVVEFAPHVKPCSARGFLSVENLVEQGREKGGGGAFHSFLDAALSGDERLRQLQGFVFKPALDARPAIFRLVENDF